MTPIIFNIIAGLKQLLIMTPIIFNKLKPPIDLAACGILKIKCIYKLKLALSSRSWLSQLARES